MEKGSQTYVGFMSNGENGLLQGPKSDVQLLIPDGVYGPILGCVYTDNSLFCQKIPNDECIIAPMVELYINSLGISDSQKRERYQIRIPHAADTTADENLVKVRKYYGGRQIDVEQHNTNKNQDTYYVMDEKFITIYTQHFCQFTCSQCQHEGCKNSAKVILYGSIRTGGSRTFVNIETFFCSFLFKIMDYEKVSSNENFQKEAG